MGALIRPALFSAGPGQQRHSLLGGQGALPQDSMGKPWNGDYGFSSGDLVRDLTHNFFLETGVRNGKLKVYDMVDHPAARALTGYLLVRGGVHQVAYARAVERLTGADLTKMSVLRFRHLRWSAINRRVFWGQAPPWKCQSSVHGRSRPLPYVHLIDGGRGDADFLD